MNSKGKYILIRLSQKKTWYWQQHGYEEHCCPECDLQYYIPPKAGLCTNCGYSFLDKKKEVSVVEQKIKEVKQKKTKSATVKPETDEIREITFDD